MRTTPLARYQFTNTLMLEFPDKTASQVERITRLIMRHGTTYARIQEDWCNREMSDAETTRVERQERNIEKRIDALALELGCINVTYSGDPRGHTIKLVVPSGKTDDWGQTGICVPTS